MFFKLEKEQSNYMLAQPETGMGYQKLEACKNGSYQKERFLVLNSEIAIEMNGSESEYVRKVINEGLSAIKMKAQFITLTSRSVLSERQFSNMVNESGSENQKGAIDNPVVNADGKEVFIRLSAFEDDNRIDQVGKRLLPGSYTTTEEDYRRCKTSNYDPIERYALPNNNEIKIAFHIRPWDTNTLQRGMVQPANGKNGGGDEAYFANGTSIGIKESR
jgi:hypothetical protein